MGVFKYDFDNIARNALSKYALKNKCADTDLNIMMYMDDSGNDCYAVYLNSSFLSKVSIMDLLNKKIDFTGESLVISIFIKQELKKLAEENNIEISKIRVMIGLSEAGKILLYLLNGGNAIKILNSDTVLSDEKFAEASNEVIKQIAQ